MDDIVRKSNELFAVILILVSIMIYGCSVKLIADYDEATDKAVTELQRKMETFFIDLESKVGTDAAKYEEYVDFYKEVKVDISAIELRASALPKNDITLQQIKLLKDNLSKLEQLHKTGITHMALVLEPRRDFNTALSEILKLELAKKRGK